jgi:hypothetical protein
MYRRCDAGRLIFSGQLEIDYHESRVGQTLQDEIGSRLGVKDFVVKVGPAEQINENVARGEFRAGHRRSLNARREHQGVVDCRRVCGWRDIHAGSLGHWIDPLAVGVRAGRVFQHLLGLLFVLSLNHGKVN